MEHQWAENYRTVDGSILHEKAHGGGTESRGDLLIVRAMRIHSAVLGVSGECDVVEFHRSENGVTLQGRDGLWSPFPIEYKRGKPKPHDADELQLCAQAMCLEEMLCCQISDGALFYGEPRRRTPVAFTDELRQRVRDSLAEMHDYLRRGCTPKVKPQKGCSACSLKELCLPELMKAKPVSGAHGRVRNRQSVAPFAGAWIEIVNLGGCYILVASLPSRERGLKFVAVGAQTNSFASLPSRERGLKFLQGRSCARSLRVAPFAEAWIEMRYTRLPRRRVMSLPSRSDTDSRIASLPSNLAPVPIPHNLSPTPTKTFAHVMTHVL